MTNEKTLQVSNPFIGPGGDMDQRKTMAMVEVEGQRAVAETQAAMTIAKHFPRDQIAAMDRIINSCTRKTLAEGAIYEYPKGGTNITGPSIRLAEVLAQNWGNIDFGIKEIAQRDGESTVMSYAHDLETNTRQTKIFHVRHYRHTKSGGYQLTDPRDIYELVANQGARRLRACILGIIPGDVVEAAKDQCELTLKTNFPVTPERLSSLVKEFEKYAISKAMIEKRIQRRVDAITPALMVQLGKIYNSIKDGMSSAGDWFEVQARGVAENANKVPLDIDDDTKTPSADPGNSPEAASNVEQDPVDQSTTLDDEDAPY